ASFLASPSSVWAGSIRVCLIRSRLILAWRKDQALRRYPALVVRRAAPSLPAPEVLPLRTCRQAWVRVRRLSCLWDQPCAFLLAACDHGPDCSRAKASARDIIASSSGLSAR